jgi:glycogen synthase
MRLPERILMTADTLGGVWTYALELARSLQRFDIQVTLATMGGGVRPDQAREAAALSNLELCEGGYRLEWMEHPWRDVQAAGEWLLRLEDRVRPDIVHLNGYAHAALPWSAPVVVVAHSCVYSWFSAVRHHAPSSHWRKYHDAVRAGLRAASVVTAPTKAMLDAAELHYGRFRRGPVIPNGRHPLPGSPTPGRRSLRSGEHFVLSAGRVWDEAKNIGILEHVAPHVAWPICVAGDIRHPGGGCVRIQHVGVLGRLDSCELAQWMASASIFVLPALYEPFGLSLLEAALSGCALVAGDIPSLREVWGDAAIFVPPRDAAAIATAINGLVDDEAFRARMSEAAALRAREFYPERMAERYIALYSQLLRPRRRQPSREGLHLPPPAAANLPDPVTLHTKPL